MNPIEQAVAHFKKILPHGKDCPHDWDGFRALDDAQAERIRFQEEIARLREDAERAKMDRNRISMEVRKEWSEKLENCIMIHDRELAKVKAERDLLAAEVERLTKAHAVAVKLLIRARKITDDWGHLAPGECDHWENQTDNYLDNHREAAFECGTVSKNEPKIRQMDNPTPAVRVRRVFDNAEKDFFYNSEGVLPLDEITEWSKGEPRVVTHYDHGPNKIHYTPKTVSEQPPLLGIIGSVKR